MQRSSGISVLTNQAYAIRIQWIFRCIYWVEWCFFLPYFEQIHTDHFRQFEADPLLTDPQNWIIVCRAIESDLTCFKFDQPFARKFCRNHQHSHWPYAISMLSSHRKLLGRIENYWSKHAKLHHETRSHEMLTRQSGAVTPIRKHLSQFEYLNSLYVRLMSGRQWNSIGIGRWNNESALLFLSGETRNLKREDVRSRTARKPFSIGTNWCCADGQSDLMFRLGLGRFEATKNIEELNFNQKSNLEIFCNPAFFFFLMQMFKACAVFRQFCQHFRCNYVRAHASLNFLFLILSNNEMLYNNKKLMENKHLTHSHSSPWYFFLSTVPFGANDEAYWFRESELGRIFSQSIFAI